MRYPRIPKVETILLPTLAGGKAPLVLSLLTLVRDMLGVRPEWRQDESWMIAYDNIVDELEAHQEEGDIVAIDDEHAEKLLQVMRVFEPAPQAARVYNRMTRAVMMSPKKPPTPVEKAETAKKKEAE